jgi:biopolymer transport protein ExbD
MAFAAAGRSTPLADINVTPLVDVMLVLLIIFIVTAPMVARPIMVGLPQSVPPLAKPLPPPEPILLRVDAGNQLSWDGESLQVSQLQERLADAVRLSQGTVPELRISADPASEYQTTAKVLAAAKNARMERIAFVR